MYTLHIFSLFSLFFIFFSFRRSGVTFHFWTNFTAHFILLGSTYKSLNKKNILKDLHKFHRCYLTPFTIWHVNVCTCMLKILWVLHALKGWCCWWCCWWMRRQSCTSVPAGTRGITYISGSIASSQRMPTETNKTK